MTEDDAKAWLTDTLSVSRETMEKLEAFAAMVVAESRLQNLISAASSPHIWARHIVDSAQLLTLLTSNEEEERGPWLDLGTGAGFPGVVLAIVSNVPITFVESRRKRINFLADACKLLNLPHVSLVGGELEKLPIAPFSVITARAFAPLPKLLGLAHRFSTPKTVWLLPKGARAREEVEDVKESWRGVFHVEQSITDPAGAIIIGRTLAPKGRA